jgi:hypothetical protein
MICLTIAIAQFQLLLYSRLYLRADGDMGGSIGVSQIRDRGQPTGS